VADHIGIGKIEQRRQIVASGCVERICQPPAPTSPAASRSSHLGE
jgi:hypothetical protein